MTRPEIRDARPADAPELATLLAVLGYPADPATVRQRMDRLRQMDPAGRVLVAVVEGRVLGLATVHCTPVLHRATDVGRITGLAVHSEARGLGLGRLLVEAAESYLTGLGVARIEVTSGPTHADAHPFYRRLAYLDQGIRFAKAVDGAR
jgi:GNAT superfamily N-acetyltransferase